MVVAVMLLFSSLEVSEMTAFFCFETKNGEEIYLSIYLSFAIYVKKIYGIKTQAKIKFKIHTEGNEINESV